MMKTVILGRNCEPKSSSNLWRNKRNFKRIFKLKIKKVSLFIIFYRVMCLSLKAHPTKTKKQKQLKLCAIKARENEN